MLYRDAFSRSARAAGQQATGYRLLARARSARVSYPSLQPPASSQVRSREARDAARQATAYCLAAALLALLASASASAANWEFAPRVEGGYRYNDNYRLELPGGEIEVSGAEADAELVIRTIDPRTTFELAPRVRATYFPDEPEEDSADYFLRAALEDETPRRRVGFLADFAQEDVVRSEFPDSDIDGGLGQPGEGDSGRFIQRNRRDRILLSPYFSYDLSERYRLDLDARYMDANYERNFEGAQQDFSELAASGGVGIRLSPRSTLLVRGVVSQYETSTDADAYGANIEYGTDFSPTSHFYVRLGAQETEGNDGASDTSVVAGLGGRWQSQRNRLFLDFTRTVRPVAAGTIVERHQLRFRLNHDISQRVTTVVGARISRDESIDELSTYPTREYAAADAGIEWRWHRQWALVATYTYRWQEYDDEPSDASANAFLVGLVYEPQRAE